MLAITLDILIQGQEINEIIEMLESAKTGKYELKHKYLVLKEFSTKAGRVYKRDDFILMSPAGAKDLVKSGRLKVVQDQPEKEELIRKIKLYIDFRGKCKSPEVEFSEDYNFIKIYASQINNEQLTTSNERK
jgi:hypothetical protein